MSHFYRLYTVNDSAGTTGVEAISSYRPSGKDGSLPTEWRRALLQDEISLDPPWLNAKMYRAPRMPPGFEQSYAIFRLKPGAALPDIHALGTRALVSERAKTVLESCDDFSHEYIETEIQDEMRQRINKKPYFLLSVRRILKVDELGPYGAIENKYEMFCPYGTEEEFLPVVQRNPELKDRLAKLPMWRQFGNWPVIYLSETVLKALRKHGVNRPVF